MSAQVQPHPSAETLAADALAQSRSALMIAGSIERRDIFQPCVVWDLCDLIRKLDAEIDDATVSVNMWPADDCDVTGNSWIETIWTHDALAMAAVRIELARLCEAIDAVLDRDALHKVLPVRKPRP